jgi:hypothetical protein
MKPRSFPTALAAVLLTAALGTAGCGGSDAKISADDATAAVAKAAGVKLKPDDVPADAKKQGLKASSSNTTTASTDQQMVFVFTLKDADTVGKLKGSLSKAVPAGGGLAKVFSHENVVVIYGAIGKDDRSAQVRKAVEALS